MRTSSDFKIQWGKDVSGFGFEFRLGTYSSISKKIGTIQNNSLMKAPL